MQNKTIGRLRALMKRNGIDAYLIPSSDPHQDEYVPEFWQRRKFLSGFTGSAGDLVITRKKAVLWTDSRYFLQAENQLDGKTFTLFKLGQPGVPAWPEWVSRELKPGETFGFDPRLITQKDYTDLKKTLEEKAIGLKGIEINMVDEIWQDRPAPPKGKLELLPKKYSGESAESKLRRLRLKMAEADADALIITLLDSIAWLFNFRGTDIESNPVAISYSIVTPKRAFLFVESEKMTSEVRTGLRKIVEFHSYQDFGPELLRLKARKKRVWVDGATASRWVVGKLEKGAKLISKPDPIALLKAVKNKTQIQGLGAAHVRDGAAMVKFLLWLENHRVNGKITELSAGRKLQEIKSAGPLYRGPSFRTISAFGSHAAIVHYFPTAETDRTIKKSGIYLVDAGSQYLDATTDITRTITVETPTEEQKDCFTRVLKGLINLSVTSFPQGTSGRQLDAIARLPLWEKGFNFGHGVGHGVGSYLNVHEGPQAISPQRCTGVPLEPGMVVSIEPGYYRENEYGIRIENLVLVCRDNLNSSRNLSFLRFETLTLCPIDLRLIEKKLLTSREIQWLNFYHLKVHAALSPLLEKGEKKWLFRATKPV